MPENTDTQKSCEPPSSGSLSSALFGFSDPTYGTLPDLLNVVRNNAIEGYCMRIGECGGLYRIYEGLRTQGADHAVLDLIEIYRSINQPGDRENFERLGSALFFGMFSIGVREGWIIDEPNAIVEPRR